MKLTKENVYIDLRGKSKEELTDLWEFLNSIGENQYDGKELFISDSKKWRTYLLGSFNQWTLSMNTSKTEVTIEQLKEILQPMELSLTEQLQEAEAEVKRLQSLIEEENKPKVGDWIIDNGIIRKVGFNKIMQEERKITNKQLIELLEQEIK